MHFARHVFYSKQIRWALLRTRICTWIMYREIFRRSWRMLCRQEEKDCPILLAQGRRVFCIYCLQYEGLIFSFQILENWRSKRVIDPQVIDSVISTLEIRQAETQDDLPEPENDAPTVSRTQKTSQLPRQEVFRRIEEDRERHKRLRERRWVQPTAMTQQQHNPGLTSFLPLDNGIGDETGPPIDIEFDNDWETLSDWNEDDDEACAEENALCFTPQDLAERRRRIGLS
ncbi:hypothetical protein E1B28_004992 [Marasmius oreades]|uniref:CTD kinase subunit gamma Ctk3 C-terminal domain-containing protein n=1 Tax=Marasmius oreades TaxID=181124 RepID=A0A9P7UZV0_9AGAR|nr:uncharacterized protein E1B28_004992 [Marasmius oreades]KAG7097666.1 hypothetical protein E1B28_004992 [Marasmius oreades]